MKMPKKLKARWIKALRSGEYGQTKGTLTDGKGNFCCLGVLQHVHSGGYCDTSVVNERVFASLPRRAWWAKAGIVLQPHDPDFRQLITMNDGVLDLQKSFKQIANWIERNIETTD